MYCLNCGTKTCGKYCCNCGRKVESPLERFRREERRARRDFLARCKSGAPFVSLNANHFADSAWLVSTRDVARGLTIDSTEEEVAPAFGMLRDCANRALRLYYCFLRDAEECGVRL